MRDLTQDTIYTHPTETQCKIPLATETTAGLLSPEMYQKLQLSSIDYEEIWSQTGMDTSGTSSYFNTNGPRIEEIYDFNNAIAISPYKFISATFALRLSVQPDISGSQLYIGGTARYGFGTNADGTDLGIEVTSITWESADWVTKTVSFDVTFFIKGSSITGVCQVDTSSAFGTYSLQVKDPLGLYCYTPKFGSNVRLPNRIRDSFDIRGVRT